MFSSLHSRVRTVLPAAVAVFSLLSAACGASPSPTPVVLDLRALLASTDLAQGQNRFVFALLDSRLAPVKASVAQVSLSYFQEGRIVRHGDVEAVFRGWPSGPGGVFTAQVNFPQPGRWLAEVVPVDGEAGGELARLSFEVTERSATPSLGALAPRSATRTLADGTALEELTSDPAPDPDLYQMTIAQALDSGRPLLVTFATPAFCTSVTCGPQVDIIKELKEAYKDRVNVIHVEVYENPREMREDLNTARISPVIDEWSLPSEPFTFLMDTQGRVAGKFEAFTSYEELDEALKGLLEG